MTKSKKVVIAPTKCTRCDGAEIRHTELTMYGKLGFMGPDYRFDVFICKNCGFSEPYFKGAKWIA